jgi:hypothetical protein
LHRQSGHCYFSDPLDFACGDHDFPSDAAPLPPNGHRLMRSKAPASTSQSSRTWRILNAMIAAAAAGLSTAGV